MTDSELRYCSFQHAVYGWHVSARYEDGHLHLAMMDTLDSEFAKELMQGETEEQKNAYIQSYQDTEEWINTWDGIAISSADDAGKFLRSQGHDAHF